MAKKRKKQPDKLPAGASLDSFDQLFINVEHYKIAAKNNFILDGLDLLDEEKYSDVLIDGVKNGRFWRVRMRGRDKLRKRFRKN